jgi:hypothetical protein
MADILKTLLIDDETNQKRLLSDCVRLIDEEVASKRGLSGLAIKGAFKIVRSVKPGFIEEVMEFLLPEFVAHLEPVYDQYQAQDDEKLEQFLVRRDQQVADQLLGITDRHANRTKNQGVKVAYGKLRPQAQKHVATAIPRVAKMLSTYVTE